MCWILYKPAGTKWPNELPEWFRIANLNNPDGFGAMALKREHVEYRKDFRSLDELLDWCYRREALDVGVHFRNATSGEVNVSNRHPFPLTSVLSELRQTTRAS